MKLPPIQTAINQHFPQESAEILLRFNWELIEEFHRFLIEKNIEGGFFSKRDSEHIAMRHITESIYFVYSIQKDILTSRVGSHESISHIHIADVGTGPGLPGFLFACLIDPPHVTLIDSARRKLGLTEIWWKNIEKSKYLDMSISRYLDIKYTRAEEWEDGREGTFDIVTMRATVPYPFSIEVICRMVKKNGFFLPFLGKEYDWGIVEKRILSETGFILKREISLDSLGFLGERKIKVLKKTASPKHGIPREWKFISKESKEVEWAK